MNTDRPIAPPLAIDLDALPFGSPPLKAPLGGLRRGSPLDGPGRLLLAASLLASLTLGACGTAPTPTPTTQETAPEEPTPGEPAAPTSRPSSSTADRAEAARGRLAALGEAGAIAQRCADRHGGFEAWFKGESLRFRYDYRPLGDKDAKNSVQTVDLLGSRAYHDLDEPARGQIAWDGRRAWSLMEGGGAFPARFWALTPYYFVAAPFVLGDPGVRLEIVADDPADAGLPPADVLRLTFAPGTGDAPDDYYILYVAKDDGRLLALRYVVSWKPFVAARNLKHTPEKLLVYEALTAVGGLTLAGRQSFFAFPEGKRGDKVTEATVSELVLGAPFDPERLEPPEGAVVDTSLDPFLEP